MFKKKYINLTVCFFIQYKEAFILKVLFKKFNFNHWYVCIYLPFVLSQSHVLIR